MKPAFYQRNLANLDFGSSARSKSALDSLGFSCSRNSIAWGYDSSYAQYIPYAANTYCFSGENGRTGLVSDIGQTNQVLYSSEDNAAWVDFGTPTIASANSIIFGRTGRKITAGAAGDRTEQVIGTFSAGTESAYMIVEQGTAAAADLRIYDDTGAAIVVRARLTFADGSVSIAAGTPVASGSRKISDSGPNGGVVWQLYFTYTATSGNARRVSVYPAGTASSGYSYLHHVQVCETAFVTNPIITTSAAATTANNVITTSSLPPYWSTSGMSVITVAQNAIPEATGNPIIAVSDGSADNLAALGNIGPTSITEFLAYFIATTDYTPTPVASLTDAAINTYGGSIKTGACVSAANGSASTPTSPAAIPTFTRMDIGNTLGGSFWNGRIFSIKLIAGVGLSATELAGLTG